MDEKKTPPRVSEVPPALMPEVLDLAADLYSRERAKITQREETEKLVTAAEEVGLPAEYLERAASIVLARQGERIRRRRRRAKVALLAAPGLVLAVLLGWFTALRTPPPLPPPPTPPALTETTQQALARLEGLTWTADTASPETELRLVSASAGDGVATSATRGGRKCVTPVPGFTPPSLYLYFDIDDRLLRGDPPGPVSVRVEFFDDTSLGRLVLHYDSATGDHLEARYREAEAVFGNQFLGTRTWRTATFHLRRPRFLGGQNYGADFRLTIWDYPIEQARNRLPLFVRAVRLTPTFP